jgi:ABC-type multidrug transport system ATPase subunit
VLRVQGLSKQFGAIWALRDATFSVADNQVVGLIGPNGAGKTTLFRCLAGLLAFDAGTIVSDQPLLFLPDGIWPWADQRVDHTLDFAADAFRSERDWRGELGTLLRLDDVKRKRLGQLSKGQRKRVLLAAALASPHALLLLDEPFDGLDLRHAREVSQYFRDHARERTFFLSIHSMHHAEHLCDQFVVLSDGTVVAEGTLDDLRTRAGTANAELEDVVLSLSAGADPSLRSG